MKRELKRVLVGLLLAGLAGYAVFSAMRPLAAELVEVRPGEVAKSFAEEGTVVATREQEIYSLYAGKVAAVEADEGESVEAGDLLLRLDTQELDYQLDQLKSQLASVRGQEQQALNQPYAAQVAQQQLAIEQAELELTQAQESWERASALYAAGAVSEEDYLLAERTVQQMENLLAQQEQALALLEEQGASPGTRQQFQGLRDALTAQISLLEYQRSQAMVTAPFAGRVKSLSLKQGAIVTPGALLAAVFAPDAYQVEVFLLEEDLLGVRPGIPIRATWQNSAGELAFDGTVTAVAAAAEEQVSALGLVQRKVKVTAELEGDTQALRPGYSLEVEFTTNAQQDKLAVPKTALFPHEGGDALWVVRKGRASIQPVQSGLETGEEIVIEKGLAPGDLVVVNPKLEGLKEGKRVRPLA